MKFNLSRIALIFTICVCSSLTLFAQDPGFTNPMYFNPAYAGTSGGSRIIANYRNQWPEISANFVTYSASYDQPVPFLSGGVGIHFISDYDGGGTFITNAINGTYAYNLKINEKLLIRPALSFGYREIRWDASKLYTLVFDSINNTYTKVPLFQNDKIKGNLNIGAGVVVSYKKMVFGFALDHINRPDEGFSTSTKLPIKITLHANYEYDISEKLALIPGILYQRQQTFTQIIPSVLFKFYSFKVGIATRFNLDNYDSVIGMIGYGNDKISVGYSYDYTISKLTNSTGGSHEISIIFKFNQKEKFQNQKITPSFGF